MVDSDCDILVRSGGDIVVLANALFKGLSGVASGDGLDPDVFTNTAVTVGGVLGGIVDALARLSRESQV